MNSLVDAILTIAKALSVLDYKHAIIYEFFEKEKQADCLLTRKVLISYITKDNYLEHHWTLRPLLKVALKRIAKEKEPVALFVTHRYGNDISTHTITKLV